MSELALPLAESDGGGGTSVVEC